MKSSCRIVFSASVIAVCALLTGCATSQIPSSAGVLSLGNPDMAVIKTNRYVVMCDAVITRYSSFGKNPVDVALSTNVAQLTADTVKRYMQMSGYQVTDTMAPIVGGYFTKTNVFNLVNSGSSSNNAVHSPFYTDTRVAADPEYENAIQSLSLGVWNSFSQARDMKPFQYFMVQKVKETTLKVLAEKTHADAIVMVLQNGVRVSSGTSIAQGLGSSVGIAIISLGTVSGSSYKKSALESYIAIVNLHTGEISWANSRRFTKGCPMFDKDYFQDDWPQYMLYHMPRMVHDH